MAQETGAERARCRRCGRPVWSAESTRTGYGKGCRARVRLAAELAARHEEFQAWQVEKARELIELAAIVPDGEPGVYQAASSDGSQVYRSGAAWCSCKSRTTCYHQVAAAILNAA